MNAWLTPDALPSGLRSCVLQFPDSEEWAAIVRGCLFLLSEERNFEEFGSVSVALTADTFRQTLFDFSQGGCVIVPIGAVLEFAGSTLPIGFLWADGSLVSRTTYAALFAAIGTAHGVGDGTSTFGLPNRKGRVAVGRDTGQTEFDVLGETGGAKTHALTTGEMPVHTHVQDAHAHTSTPHTHIQDQHRHSYVAFDGTAGSGTAPVQAATGTTDSDLTNFTTPTNQNTQAIVQNFTATNQNAGGGGSHNNLQPYLVENFIIRAL